MPPSPRRAPAPYDALSLALRNVRVLRGLRTSEVARMMGMTRRSYERFESCRIPMRVDRLLAFADATQSDPLALFVAALSGEPAIASEVAGNKLCLIQAAALKRFCRDQGDAVRDLDSQTIMAAAAQMYADLAKHVGMRRATLANLFSEDGGDEAPVASSAVPGPSGAQAVTRGSGAKADDHDPTA